MIAQRTHGLRNALLLCECALASLLFWLFVAGFILFGGGTEAIFLSRYPIYWALVVFGIVLESAERDKGKNKTVLIQRDLLTQHRITVRQTVFSIILISVYLAIMRDRFISRVFLFSFAPTLYLVLLWANYSLPAKLAQKLFRGEYVERTLLIGSKARAEKLLQWLKRKAAFGIDVVGILCDEAPVGDVHGLPSLGNSDEVEAVVNEHRVTQIILLELPVARHVHQHLVSVAERLGARLLILSDLEEKLNHPVVNIEDDGLQFITLRPEPLQNPVNRLLKRSLDIAVALPVLAFIFPVTSLIVFLCQRRQSPGPLFFRQTRAGIQNHEFLILKYRTMHVANDDAARQASTNDPRVFPSARWLRKYSIDEIPQFWNVLRGDMSVVGPRPHLVEHNRQFSRLMANYHIRTFVKPGITGLAQVWGYRGEARDSQDILKRLESDITYLENWTLSLDFVIIFSSAWHMVAPPGTAY